MSRYTGPITRLSRSLGVMLFPNEGSKMKAFQRKNYKPGQHGQKRFSKSSEYKKQLQEKQKARFMYGISEKQSRKYYNQASKKTGVTGIEYMKILERRLDNAVFKAGLAMTRPQARQIVSHGLVKVNGRRAKTPSIMVEVGDKIEIREKSKSSKLFEEIKKTNFKNPKWISSNPKNLQAEILALPDKEDIESLIEHQLITEYYSK